MLRQSVLNANPLVSAAVEKLIDEERRQERNERRAAVRTPLARPVLIKIQGQDDSIFAISKDISLQGIGLISDQSFVPDTTAKLEIESSTGLSQVLLSELRWCKEFGHGWFISGWHFVTVVRG